MKSVLDFPPIFWLTCSKVCRTLWLGVAHRCSQRFDNRVSYEGSRGLCVCVCVMCLPPDIDQDAMKNGVNSEPFGLASQGYMKKGYVQSSLDFADFSDLFCMCPFGQVGVCVFRGHLLWLVLKGNQKQRGHFRASEFQHAPRKDDAIPLRAYAQVRLFTSQTPCLPAAHARDFRRAKSERETIRVCLFSEGTCFVFGFGGKAKRKLHFWGYP